MNLSPAMTATMMPVIAVVIMNVVGLVVSRWSHPGRVVFAFSTTLVDVVS